MYEQQKLDQQTYPIHKEVAFVSVSKKSKVKLFLLIYTMPQISYYKLSARNESKEVQKYWFSSGTRDSSFIELRRI